MKLVIKKSAANRLQKLTERRKDKPDDKLEHFRKLILDHLFKQEDENEGGEVSKIMQKALNFVDKLAKGGKGLPVGTVREWGGKKYVKVSMGSGKIPGKWRIKYDSQTRGAKTAMSAIKRKIAAARDAREMLQIVLENRDRFSDQHGQPLPFVMELSKHVAEEQERREKAEKEKAVEKKKNTTAKTEERNAKKKGKEDSGKPYKEWEQKGADACKAGRKRKAPYDEMIIKPGQKIGSPESKESNKRAEAWYRGYDRENFSIAGMKEFFGTKEEPAGKEGKKKDEPEESEDEKRRNRSEGMKGNQNAKKDGGGDDGDGGGGISEKKQAEIRQKLDDLAVPMDEKEYSREEYDKLFPRGTVKTPIKEVKLGNDLFDKLGRKDNGARQTLIGALYQTLTDPIAVIKEGNDEVYLKSFTKKDDKGGFSTIIAVEKDTKTGRVVVTTYQRKEREIAKKIKKADGIAYLKDDSGSRANDETPSLEGGTSSSTVSPGTGEKSSDFAKIQEKYRNAKAVEGNKYDIQVGKDLLPGKWKLVEADTPTASHDEKTFQKTKGFPANGDGSTINDRDYEHDRADKEAVLAIAGDYDGRALSVDSPVIVTDDGIVISGNNRTMSSKLAARKGTDKDYIEALKKKAQMFGFTADDIGKFRHPRVVFETAENNGYSTGLFAKFNDDDKKSSSAVAKAVKMSKLITPETVQRVAVILGQYETAGDFYKNSKSVEDVITAFVEGGLLNKMKMAEYYNASERRLEKEGKSFIETVLIGGVMEERNIRRLDAPGGRAIREKLLKALLPLIENKGMKGYSINKELNEAVDIAIQVATQKDKFDSVADFSRQKKLFGDDDDPVSLEIAKKLEGTQKEFAEFMQSVNGCLKYAANGEADIFIGEVESKEEILSRMLNLKKSMANVIDFFRKHKNRKERFIKKSVPVFTDSGAVEYADRWMPESNELPLKKAAAKPVTDGNDAVIFDVALDFDGVINSYKSGWQGSDKTDEPVDGAAEAINDFLDNGLKVVIYSTRAEAKEGEETIRDYLQKLIGNRADEIMISSGKPIASVYVDDRAINFNGDWEAIPDQIEKFRSWVEKSLGKSLTWSGHKLQARTKVQGMDISIENKKGSTRSGTDKDGHDWSIKMSCDYGYIRGTVGKDKDHLDCYIGPNHEADTVYIVHQNDPVTGEYDEDKVMIGFDSEEEAKEAYLKQYDRPGFLGSIDAMGIDAFKEKAFDPANKGKMIRG